MTGSAVTDETLHRRGTTLVRRLRLEPGEATPWHSDPHHRISVVVSGDALTIEYVDALNGIEIQVPFALILWVLLVKPNGLFGRNIVERV